MFQFHISMFKQHVQKVLWKHTPKQLPSLWKRLWFRNFKKQTRPKQETSHQQGRVNLSTLGSNFVFRTSIHGNSEEELHGSTATLRRFKQTAFVGKQKITVPKIGEKKTDVTPKTLQAEILYSPWHTYIYIYVHMYCINFYISLGKNWWGIQTCTPPF